MRKVLLLVVVLAVIGGAVWFFFLRGGGGTPPGVAAELEVAHTVGFATVEQPQALSARVLAAVKSAAGELPPELKALLEPEVRAARLGFDPADAAGWQAIGLDPAGPLAMVADARLEGEAVLLAKLTDEARFLAWLEKITGARPVVEAGEVKTLTVGSARLFMGTRGAYTALIQARPGTQEGFKAFLAGGGATLADHEHFRVGFGEAKPGARGVGWLTTAQLKGLVPGEVASSVEFYAGLFPGLSLYVGPDGGGFRLVATEQGVQALRKLMVPQRSAPEFSAYLPAEGWAAVRSSVNIKEYFAGVQAMLPPAVPEEVRMQMGMAKMAFSMLTGVEWDTLAEAFSGHVVFAGELGSVAGAIEGTGAPNWLVLLGASERADAVVANLLEKVGQLAGGLGGGPSAKKIKVAGVDGHEISAGPMSIVAARVDDVLLLGPSVQAVEDAVKRSKGSGTLKGVAEASALDGEVAMGMVLDTKALKAVLAKSGGMGSRMDAISFGKDRVSFAVAVDSHGLVSQGDGGGVVALIGALAATAVPAFVSYQRRAQEAEATLSLRRLADGSVAYYQREHVSREGAVLPRQFPASAGPTPKAAPCAEGPRYAPDPGQWEGTEWTALNFAMMGPHAFQYSYQSGPTGFTARAVGDLGCTGHPVTYERVGTVDGEGNVNVGPQRQR